MNKLWILALILLIISLLSFEVYATTVTIYMNQDADYVDGYIDGTDATTLGATTWDAGKPFGAVTRRRAFLDFNTTVIPDGSTINSITINLTVDAYYNSGSGYNISIYGLTQKADTRIDNAQQSTLNNECAGVGSTLYIVNTTTWNGLTTPVSNVTALGATANSNMSALLSQNFFSICLMSSEEVTAGRKAFRSNETTSPADFPFIIVDFTPGSGSTSNATLNLFLITPSSNQNVYHNQFFRFEVNVSCNGGDCGDVNVSLDPIQQEAAPIEKSYFEKLIEFWLNLPAMLTGNAVGYGLVNTTIGAMPFYTNMSNPADNNTFPCLRNMTNSTNCTVFWYVNATNATGTFEFFAFANSTNNVSAESRHVNLTITELDNSPPVFNYTNDHILAYDTPDPQEPYYNVTLSANITDNIGLSEVEVYVRCPSGTTVFRNSSGNLTKDGDDYYAYFAPNRGDFGICNYTIWANDTSDNENNVTGNFTVADLWPPEISNITVAPQILNNASFQELINITVIDDYYIDDVWAVITFPNGAVQNYTMTNNTLKDIYELVFASTLQRGRYTVIFYANDTFGNTADTLDRPYYFYVPPYIYTDRNIYSLGQTVLIRGLGFSNLGVNVVLNITNSSNYVVPGMPNSTLTDALRRIEFNWTVPYEGVPEGNYTISAYDPNYDTTVYADIEIRYYYKEYPEGTLIIPMDTKQSTNVNDFDFLRSYGLVWRLLNSSQKVDWITTPPCYLMNATDSLSSQKFSENYCHGFFMINKSAWNMLQGFRSDPRFAGIVVHNLTAKTRIRQNQIIQLVKPTKIAVWNLGEEVLVQTLDQSYIPYTLLSQANILSGYLNSSAYDMFMVGHYDFQYYVNRTSPLNYRRLTGNISAFLQNSGDMHAECVGVDSLDISGLFIGNVTRGPSQKGNIIIANSGAAITQTHYNVTGNIGGTTPTLNVTNAPSAIDIHMVDSNWLYGSPYTHTVGRNEIVKFISKDITSGYITYAGGHLGEVTMACSCGSDCTCSQTSARAIPRNRIIDNLLFFGAYVNDETPPEIDNLTVVPSPGVNVTQFRSVVLASTVTDNALMDSVWAVVEWPTGSQIVMLNGPDYNLNYTAIFSNTSYVIDKSTPTRYNVTFFANDSDGNLINSSTYFNVLPDKIPQWSDNRTAILAMYSPSQPSLFNITWTDDYRINFSYLESNYTGAKVNYTMTLSQGDVLNGSYLYTPILPAGPHYWKSYAMDDYSQWNSTDIWIFDIQKNNQSTCIVSVIPPVASYPSQVNISCSCSNSETAVNLYRNGTDISSSNNLFISLPASSYNFTCITNTSQNYTSIQNTTIYSITKGASDVNLSLNGTQNNLTAELGSPVNITGLISQPGVGNISIYQNSTLINNGTSYITNITTYLTPGYYNITIIYLGNDNYTSSSETLFVTIQDTTNPVINLTPPTDTSGSMINRNYVLINVTATDLALKNISVFLYNSSGALINLTNTSQSQLYVNISGLADGVYYFNATAYDTSGNPSSTETRNITVDTIAPQWSNNKTSIVAPQYTPGQNYQFNATWIDPNLGTVTIEHNFTGVLTNYTVTTNNGNEYFYNYGDLPAGTYVFRFYANDSVGHINMTQQWSYIVSMVQTSINLTLNGAEANTTFSYGTTLTASFWTSALSAIMYRNGTDVSGQNNTAITLGAGYYNYSAVNAGNSNYTGSRKTFFANITQASQQCTLSFSAGSGITYGTSVTVTCSCSDGSQQLWLNNSAVASGAFTLPGGDSGFVCNTTGNANYSNSSNSTVYSVTKAGSSVNLLLNSSDSDISANVMDFVNITGTLTTGAGFIQIYLNGTLINNGSGMLMNITQFNSSGTYNLTVIYSGNQNYTSSFETHLLTISNSNPAVTLIDPLNTDFMRNDFNFSYSVSDPNGLADVKNCTLAININGTAWNTYNLSRNPLANNYIQYNINSSTNVTDTVQWYVNCTDSSGATSSSPTRVVYADNVNPTPHFINPLVDNTTVQSNVSLNIDVRVEDNNLANATILILDSTNTQMFSNFTNVSLGTSWINFTPTIDITSWTTGVYYINLTAYDFAGNMISVIRSFNVTNNPSTPSDPPGGGGSSSLCEDNKDNDGDGLCDFDGCTIEGVFLQPDPGCTSDNDNDEFNPAICVSKWDCTAWSDCANKTATRNCTDTNNCENETGKPDTQLSCNIFESYALDSSDSSGGHCRYQWECGPWGQCYSNGKQYRKCIDLGEKNPDMYCMSTAWKPATEQSCKPALEQEPMNVCTFPYIFLVLFALSYLLLFWVMNKIDQYRIPREDLVSVVNFSKLKLNLLVMTIILGLVVYFNNCSSPLVKLIIVTLVLIAVFLVYIFYESFNYLDKGKDAETVAIFEKVRKLHEVRTLCPYCNKAIAKDKGYSYHLFICSHTSKYKEIINNLLAKYLPFVKKRLDARNK